MYYLFTKNIEKFGIIKFQNYDFIQKFAIPGSNNICV